MFDMASQTINDSWRNQSKSSPNVMIIKITFLNFLYSSNFLCFLFISKTTLPDKKRKGRGGVTPGPALEPPLVV